MDALVTLAKNDQAVRAIYIWAGKSATLSGLADGSYELYYTSGSGWNEDLQIFASDAGYFRFESALQFETRREKNGVKYTTYHATLHAVPGGRVATTPVSASAYPR